MATLWIWVLAAALVVAFAGLWRHLARLRARPFRPEGAPAAGNPSAGVRYAFTTGMMPWAKESTRLHLAAYLRGVVFHAGIGAGFLGLLLALWPSAVPGLIRWLIIGVSAAGALAGWAGLAARLVERNLRRISTPDDFVSVGLVSLFLTAGALAWLNPAWNAAFFVLGAATLVAVPFTKIRHCFYFFVSRYFFGLFYGRRGVLGGAQHE